MKEIVLIMAWVCCLTSGCKGAVESNHAADGNNIKEAVAGNTDFAFDLYGKLKDSKPKENLFFSPYSISTALAMTYAGARGDTEKQMVKALNFTLPGESLHNAFGTLQNQLIQEDKSRSYELLTANALWGQKGKPILKEFLDLNKNYYGADFRLLDFRNETEKSRQIINSWIEDKTKEKIEELIPQGGIDQLTVLVLTNAIYFKGEWQIKFEEKDTEQADFLVSDRDNIKVNMMHAKEDFKYYEDEKLQTVELPYKSDELSMVVILPRVIKGIEEIEDELTTEYLGGLLSEMKAMKIDMYLPKFRITWGSFSLNDTLIALGMPDAFDEMKADFSGMNGTGGIWIDNVFHKAFIEVNEEGAEATSATGVVMTRSNHFGTPVFRADHPFIFIIKDNHSGSILFMGRLMNPTE